MPYIIIFFFFYQISIEVISARAYQQTHSVGNRYVVDKKEI